MIHFHNRVNTNMTRNDILLQMDIEQLKIVTYEIACGIGAVAFLGSYFLLEKTKGVIDTTVGYNEHVLLAGGLGLVLFAVSFGCAAWVSATKGDRAQLV